MAGIGNNNVHRGPNKDKPFRAAIVRALKAADGDPDKLDKIAQNLVDLASSPVYEAMPAIAQIADRLDGKPPQSTTISGDEDAPLRTVSEMRLTIVDPGSTSSEGLQTAPE